MVANLAHAQEYKAGDKLLNVGVGIGSTLSAAGLKSTLPPIGLSFEYGVTDKISAGAFLGYSAASQDVFGSSFKYTYIVVAAKGAYHFNFKVDKLDPYAGAIVGYNIASVSPSFPGSKLGGVIIGGVAGARYYLKDNISAFAEAGYGIAFLTVGASFKF